MIGKKVTVVVDRPMGSVHPRYAGLVYPVNYGYVPDTVAADGEEQDAYILGVDAPVERFVGRVVAIVHRRDDGEDKWVVCPDGNNPSREEIERQVLFQEQYFDHEIWL